jgi:hypothetical protein
MPFNLTRMLQWWRQAGTNNHLGGSFNLELYLAVCQAKINQPK